MKMEVTDGKILVESKLINEEIFHQLLIDELTRKIDNEKNVKLEKDFSEKEETIKNLNQVTENHRQIILTLDVNNPQDVKAYANSLGVSIKTAKEMLIIHKRDILDETKSNSVIDDVVKKQINKEKTIEPEKILSESSNLDKFNTGSTKITMSTSEQPDLDQISDIDKDIAGYDRIRVFESINRKANVTVICDGPDSIHLMINRNGIDNEEESWNQKEIMLYPGEAWKFSNVYELRIRSETQGNKYRVTEDEIIIGSTIRSVQ